MYFCDLLFIFQAYCFYIVYDYIARIRVLHFIKKKISLPKLYWIILEQS